MEAIPKPMIVILGPTATGKTRLAARIASRIDAEVISADSRQVYRGMDIGTGKDYDDYIVDGKQVPTHLIDIAEPGTEYNVYRFQGDFLDVYKDISARGKRVILCGGTGMYIEAVLRGYKLMKVPLNRPLRASMENKTDEELTAILQSYKTPHNVTDTGARNRLIRAIEIQQYYREHPELQKDFIKIPYRLYGVHFPREVVRARISKRLQERMDEGMLEEVRSLLKKGVSPDQLKFYGLEYKYITQFILGETSYDEMLSLLNTAIHQFAKRQMTWFRRMERAGMDIQWLDGGEDERLLQQVLAENN